MNDPPILYSRLKVFAISGGSTESDPPIVCDCLCKSDPPFQYRCVSVNDPGQFWTAVWECLPSLFSGLIERDLPIVCGLFA